MPPTCGPSSEGGGPPDSVLLERHPTTRTSKRSGAGLQLPDQSDDVRLLITWLAVSFVQRCRRLPWWSWSIPTESDWWRLLLAQRQTAVEGADNPFRVHILFAARLSFSLQPALHTCLSR